MMPIGWICPRCETVHAPDVKQCSCRPQFDVCPPCGPFPLNKEEWEFPCDGGAKK